jgi:tetratricopeptide (TPR) repeat protein
VNPYDYDPTRLKDLKPACARVVTQFGLGTGFLIGNSRLLTCNHVVKDVKDVRCDFGDIGRSADFSVRVRNESRDIALLEPVLAESVAGVIPPIVGRTVSSGSWWAWGFPALVDGQGVPLFGFVADPEYTDREGRKTVQLFAENLVAEDAQLGGFSGSPVLSGTEVFGMIYRVLAGKTDGKRARFGMIYAIPITAIQSDMAGAKVDVSPSPPLPPPYPKPNRQEEEQLRLFGMLDAASTTDGVLRLLHEWKGNAHVGMPPNVPLITAEKLIGMGAPRAALTALEASNESHRGIQLRALAHSLLKEHDTSHALLKRLPPSGESGGITGGVFKRRYFETGNRVWLQGALDEYERSFNLSQDTYPGINAAAVALWLGDRKLSRQRAEQVRKVVDAKPADKRDHWEWATLGEALLIDGKVTPALACYKTAIAKAPSRLRDIAVMRKQARQTLHALGRDAGKFEIILAVGGIACFTGHRVDSPGRTSPRFPRDRAEHVACLIRDELDKARVHFGFSSAADGADLLFIEQLLARGGEPTLFLPFPQEEFLQTSVHPDWHGRFKAVLARVPTSNVHILLTRKPPDGESENDAYARCNEAIQEAAVEAGRIYDEKPLLIAVLMAREKAGETSRKGGSEEAVRRWREQLHGPVVVIDPLAS